MAQITAGDWKLRPNFVHRNARNGHVTPVTWIKSLTIEITPIVCN